MSGVWDVSRDTTPGEAVSGSARMLVTLSPGDDPPYARVWNVAAVRVDSLATYQLSAWVKASALDPLLTVQLTFVTAAESADAHVLDPQGTEQFGGTVVSPGAAYQLLTASFTVPAGHDWARVYLRATSTDPATNLTVSWDEASLKQRITS